MPNHRQAEIFNSLMAKTGACTIDSDEPDQETIARVLAHLQKKVP